MQQGAALQEAYLAASKAEHHLGATVGPTGHAFLWKRIFNEAGRYPPPSIICDFRWGSACWL